MSWTVHGSRTVPDAAVALIVDEGEDPAEGQTQIRHTPAQTTTPGPRGEEPGVVMAEDTGFEPVRAFTPNTISNRAP